MIKVLVAANLLIVPVDAARNRNSSESCKPMDIMMGSHKAEPIKPDLPEKVMILPNARIERTGPAVLLPNCRDQEPKRHKRNDYPLA